MLSNVQNREARQWCGVGVIGWNKSSKPQNHRVCTSVLTKISSCRPTSLLFKIDTKECHCRKSINLETGGWLSAFSPVEARQGATQDLISTCSTRRVSTRARSWEAAHKKMSRRTLAPVITSQAEPLLHWLVPLSLSLYSLLVLLELLEVATFIICCRISEKLR